MDRDTTDPPPNWFHVSVNHWPAPGAVIQAADAAAAEAAYRAQHRLPDHAKVEAFQVEALPNGGWRRMKSPVST